MKKASSISDQKKKGKIQRKCLTEGGENKVGDGSTTITVSTVSDNQLLANIVG